MLVVKRYPGEAVVLETADGRITVHVLIRGGTVQLGIEAPETVRIRRAELAPASGNG
jgi:carbon storage regulator CsrA